jgi:glycosyltransferase involved in cell wall biosynthesis
MKVLLISGTYPPIYCGVGRYTAKLRAALSGAGQDTELITSTSVPAGDGVHPLVKKWDFSCWRPVLSYIGRSKPDLVHLQYPTTAYKRHPAVNFLPWLIKLRWPRLPLVVMIHEYHDATWLGRARILVTIWWANQVIISNEEDRRALKKLLPWKKLSLVPIGSNLGVVRVSASEREQKLAGLGLRPGEYAVYFGQVDENKGLEQLLQAAAKWPAELKLLIIGGYKESNPFHRRLKDEIARLGGRTVWPANYMDDAESSVLIGGAALGVLPFNQPASLRRSSLITFMLHGLATVTTGPVLPPLNRGTNCLCTTGNEPAQITAAVTGLYKDVELSKMISVNALELAKRFDWQNIAREHLKLYKRLV